MYIWGVKSQYKGISATACLFFPSSFDYTYSFFDSFFLCPSLLCLCRLSPGSIVHAFVLLQYLCTLSASVFFLSTSVHPHSVHLCSPPPHPMLSLVSLSLLCISLVFLVTPFLLSFSHVLAVFVSVLFLSLPVFSLVPPPFPIFFSQCLDVYSDQRKGIVYCCQYKRGHIYSVFVYGEKAEDEWFLCIFDLSLFPVAHIFSSGANEQHKLTTKQRDLHERIKWEL